jgi:predicted alpha-1,2-mannosidase
MKPVLLLSALLLVVARAAPLPVDEALPLVGAAGHGHTYPGATVPFGLVQLSPDTRTDGWDACSGYHYSDSTIMGFSHTHLSGTGAADLGHVLIMPFTGGLDESAGHHPLTAERFQSRFSHDDEKAQPGYYRVSLKSYAITAELTATAHAGMHRYTFPASEQGHLLVDLVHGINNPPTGADLKVENDHLVTGYRSSDGWARNKTVYFVIECSRAFESFGLEVDDKPLEPGLTEAKGKNVRCHLDYRTSAGQTIVLRVSLSPTSLEEARENLQAEIPTWDFGAIRESARAAWNENLARIQVDSSNPNIRQTFYSALYHTMTAPTLYDNADGSYRGADNVVRSSGSHHYSTFSLWDTFRAEHPLLTLTEPERVDDFVRSLLAFYQESPDHVLPLWPLTSCDTECMIGYHAVPVIYDAYRKGFRGFDAELAYRAMCDTARSGRNWQDEYQKLGYVSAETGKGKQAASRTLEFAFDDWCIAQMARALGKTGDFEFFIKRSQSYAATFDPATRFFRGKTARGSFREPFDPRAVSFDDFTEANAWQYAFSVPHDVPGMIKLYGGNQSFIRKLDQLFESDSDIGNYLIDVSGLVGQYSHGNEPCHHIAYLYALAGAQYKTAQRVRQIMLTQYDNTPEGLDGNDDCGQISAWYVWSAMGLYPVNPADGIYVIGSPLVEKATINLDPKYYAGGSFTIIAHGVSKQNGYVQSAKLNGEALNRPWITHEELAKGGTLVLDMGVLPNRSWGAEN